MGRLPGKRIVWFATVDPVNMDHDISFESDMNGLFVSLIDTSFALSME